MKENTKVNTEVNEETENTSAIVISEPVSTLSPAELMTGGNTEMYCSIKNDGSMKSKAKVYNMINNPDKRISDVIGEVIKIKDILAHNIEVINEETGEMINALRTVIIDENGTSYEAVSQGVTNSLARIMEIFGQPETWDEPIPVKPVQKSTRNGNNKVTTLKVEL